MPSLHEVTLLKVDLRVPKDSLNQFPKYIVSLDDLNFDHGWSWQVERKFIANIVLWIRLILSVCLILHANCLVSIGEPQESGRFHIIT